jgi:predicted acyl esterase
MALAGGLAKNRLARALLPGARHTDRGPQQPLSSGVLQSSIPAPVAAPTVLREVPTPSTHVVYGMPRASVDPYSATFTLPPQQEWMEIIGSPTARLWISTPASDADGYVYLEAVHRMGGAEIIARGVLRASHRKIGTPPYKTGGLPWHTHLRADFQPLRPNEPVALDIALSPTAYTIRSGDLLRLAVTTRAPSNRSPIPPPVQILSDENHASYLEIPDVDTRSAAVPGFGSEEKVSAPGCCSGYSAEMFTEHVMQKISAKSDGQDSLGRQLPITGKDNHLRARTRFGLKLPGGLAEPG